MPRWSRARSGPGWSGCRHEHPFLLNGRYAADRAEVSYWEEAADVADAAILALRLWETHRATAGLPEWDVVGLEVVDQDDLPAPGARRRADRAAHARRSR